MSRVRRIRCDAALDPVVRRPHQRLLGVGPRHVGGWKRAKEQAAADGRDRREQQRRRVDGHFIQTWGPFRRHGDEDVQQSERQRNAEDASQEGDQRALHEQLRHQPQPLSSERGTHGHFVLAGAAARHKQAGHVDAGDEQQDADRTEQHEQRLSHALDQPVRQAFHDD